MLSIFDKTRTNDMSYALSVLSEKNRQIARNVAHKDTPMYKAKKLDFKEAMQAYYAAGEKGNLYLTHERHIDPSGGVRAPSEFVRHQNNPSTRTDGNDVNLDYEMTEQAASTILFSAISEITGNKFASIKDIIRSK